MDGPDSAWRQSQYSMSQPTKDFSKEAFLKEVDVNCDGRIGFLEYLLHQYREIASPVDFVKRYEKAYGSAKECVKLSTTRRSLDKVYAAVHALDAE